MAQWKEQIASTDQKITALRGEVLGQIAGLRNMIAEVARNLAPTHRLKDCTHCGAKGTIPVTEDAPLVTAIRTAMQDPGVKAPPSRR
jgi:hypothetical protein